MSEGKKLFRLEVTTVFYALAADASEADLEAVEYAREELGNSGEAYVSIWEIHRGHVPSDGWSRLTHVYGSDDDAMLGECIDACEEVE